MNLTKKQYFPVEIEFKFMQTDYWKSTRRTTKSRRRRFLDFIFGGGETVGDEKMENEENLSSKDGLSATVSLDGLIEKFSSSALLFIMVENDFIFFNKFVKNRQNIKSEANPGIYCIKDDGRNMERKIAKAKAEKNEKMKKLRECKSREGPVPSLCF